MAMTPMLLATACVVCAAIDVARASTRISGAGHAAVLVSMVVAGVGMGSVNALVAATLTAGAAAAFVATLARSRADAECAIDLASTAALLVLMTCALVVVGEPAHTMGADHHMGAPDTGRTTSAAVSVLSVLVVIAWYGGRQLLRTRRDGGHPSSTGIVMMLAMAGMAVT